MRPDIVVGIVLGGVVLLGVICLGIKFYYRCRQKYNHNLLKQTDQN